MRLKFTALALAATLFGCAPADWVDPSSVSQRYEVFYEELGSIFDAEAVFQSDQGPIVLADPSQVHLDEVQFTKISDDPSYIRQVRGQAFQASHVWRWVDSDGRSYENRFSLIPLLIAEAPATVSERALVYGVTLGEAIEPSKDRLSFKVALDRGDGYVRAVIPARVVSSTRLEVPLPERYLADLGSSTIWIQLVRERKERLQQATRQGGGLRWKYITSPRRVEVVSP